MSSIAPADLTEPRPSVTTPGRPWIRTTYQFCSAIPCNSATANAKWSAAVACILRWAKQKVPGNLTIGAWKGESFSLMWPGQKLECIAVPSRGLWTLRLEHPDVPFAGRAAVPGRTWTTDIGLARHGDALEFGIRIFCASLPYGDAEVALTRPRIVADLSRETGLSDHRLLNSTPWLLQSEADVEALFDLVHSPNRRLPVVVLTQPDRKRLDLQVSDYVLNPDDLAKKTLGLAHVVKLPWDLGYKWTELVGKPWSVFLGAVRTYMPGFDINRDAPGAHPNVFAERIVFWKQPGDKRIGEGPFSDFLISKLSQFASTRRLTWANIAFAAEARTLQAEVARQEAKAGADWEQLYEEEIAGLKAEVEELRGEIQEYCQISDRAEMDRDHFEAENRILRFQLDSIRARLAEKLGSDPDQETPIPDNYDDLPEWVDKHLAGRVVLHPRAVRGLKKAAFEDVELVYRSLLLLASEYRNLSLGLAHADSLLQQRLQELGLRCDGSISKERAGEEGDTYFVRFPAYSDSGPKQFLEWHLRKGTTKEDRYCLAIYFFWDVDTQQVVVGWLPSHLDNRMT